MTLDELLGLQDDPFVKVRDALFEWREGDVDQVLADANALIEARE